MILSAPGWEVLGRSGNAPVLLRKKIGKGAIWLLTPEMQDYQIAAQLQSILALSGIRPQVRLARAKEQDLAVNVEIHAAKRGSLTLYFLLNQDTYPNWSIFPPGRPERRRSPFWMLFTTGTWKRKTDGPASSCRPTAMEFSLWTGECVFRSVRCLSSRLPIRDRKRVCATASGISGK